MAAAHLFSSRRSLALAVFFGVLLSGGFLVGWFFLRGDGPSEADEPGLLEAIPARQTVAAQGDRFVGELLGIHIAPSLSEMPAAIVEERARRHEGGCVDIPLEQADSLQFPRALQMPRGYTLVQGTPHATACSGTPSGIEWQYIGEGPQGTPASISVGRGVSKTAYAQVPASRISTAVIGGRDAIVIRPATADGLVQNSQVIFPESFGKTRVYAFNLSETALLEVAAAVAEASR